MKYRIKRHPEAFYTIQKRVFFIFWKELWFWTRDEGLDTIYSRHIYKEPPLGQLQRLEEYG